MSVSEYVPLAEMYGLTASHPLLQAYYCSYEAAMRSQYTPLFYARHKVGPVFSLNAVLECNLTQGAFFWDYSGRGLLGIDGIRVLLEAIPFLE